MRTQNAAGPTPTICVAIDDNHDSIPIRKRSANQAASIRAKQALGGRSRWESPDRRVCEWARSEEHTSELQSLMRISYAVFCLKKNTQHTHTTDLASAQCTTTT